MSFRFSEGTLAVDISVRPERLSFCISRNGVDQFVVNFFKNDPRSNSLSNLERLCRELRRDGCPDLASLVEETWRMAKDRWYDPESAYDSLHSGLQDLDQLGLEFVNTSDSSQI